MRKQRSRKTAPPPPEANDNPASYLGRPQEGWRERMFVIIFEADTVAGRRFDFALIGMIILSVIVVMLDSVVPINRRFNQPLQALEWFFTFMFTLEYIARLVCVKHPIRYARSFFGIVDLLSVIPNYAALLMPELHALIDLRLLRLLRMFRLLKLTSYVAEYSMLGNALIASRRKILIFLSVVAIVVILNGTLLYVIESGPDSKFTSVPTSVYFAISAITTVGFGDITPLTDLGRAITSLTMLIGWSILAVPTGIITSELTLLQRDRPPSTRTCPVCIATGLDPDARFCQRCGTELPVYNHD